jgi:hypothetical protein
MIVIAAVLENGTLKPQRVLTYEENLTITSSVCNGIEYIYYQDDGSITEEIISKEIYK